MFMPLDYLLSLLAEPSARQIEAWENDKDFVLAIDMPGYDKGKISVLREGELLTIRAEHEEANEKGRRFLVKGNRRSMSRRFALPDGLNPEKADAEYRDGVLTVTIPRKKPRNKAIKVK